jgi:conjugative transfer signal peptidase TraF
MSFRRRRRWRRLRRIAFIALGIKALGLIWFVSFARPVPLIIYNASASAPIGFYRVLPVEPLRRGDLVLARTPDSVRNLAAERHYLPADVPLVKRIAALGGDTVCAKNHAIKIDRKRVAEQLTFDRLGRPLPIWSGCRTLGADEVFLLMQGVPDSFDGRYFGPIQVRTIIGRLVPLWLR